MVRSNPEPTIGIFHSRVQHKSLQEILENPFQNLFRDGQDQHRDPLNTDLVFLAMLSNSRTKLQYQLLAHLLRQHGRKRLAYHQRLFLQFVAALPFQPECLGVLENLASRGYTDGFYQRHSTHEQQNYISGYSQSHQQQFCGEIKHYDDRTGMAYIDVKNKFAVGDRVELILPSGNHDITVTAMQDKHGKACQEALGGGYEVSIPLPAIAADFGLLARYL